MAAITSAITAVAGLGLSVNQMIKQNAAKKNAEQAGAAAVARVRGMEEQNMLDSLQANTAGIELAKANQAQREATIVPTLQKDARTALGGAVNVAEQGRKSDLDLAAQTSEAEYERDVKVLGEDAAIEKRRMARLEALEQMEIEGAGAAAADAAQNEAAALGGIINFAGDLGAATLPKMSGKGYEGGPKDPNAKADTGKKKKD